MTAPTPQERAHAITVTVDRARLRSLAKRAITEPAMGKRVIWLWRLGDTLAGAARGHVPCDAGCSHCCHIPLMLSEQEAKVIARETGRKLVTPPAFSIDPNPAYTGVPCPMLQNGQCGIYENRPMACRVHYSLAADEAPCVVTPGAPNEVPYLDNRDYHKTYVLALREAGPRLADIRDFFI